MKTHSYFKFYKPYGVLSQFINNQTKRKNKTLISDLHDFPKGTMAVGRLDEKSEGLLLLTTDGKFSNDINSSKYEKEYYVLVDGMITNESLKQLEQGIHITVNGKPYFTKALKASLLKDTSSIIPRVVRDKKHGPTSWITITINEGKFRQVRKMTSKIGHPTLRLIRARIGDYHIGDLRPGGLLLFNPK